MYKEINELLDKARRGDIESKERLLERVRPLIIKQIQRYYYNRDIMEDLIQEGYLLVLESIENYDEGKGVYFLGYIKTMLKFHYLDKHKERVHQSLNSPLKEDGEGEIIDFLEDESKGQEDLILDKEESKELKDALDKLTERQREVIILFYLKNLSIADIAQQLDITYRTVVNTKTRALEIIRESI